MGKVLLVSVVVATLVIGQPASGSDLSNQKTPADSLLANTSNSLLASPALTRAYDAVPRTKTGAGVAAHLRNLSRVAQVARAPKFEVVMSPTVNKTQVQKSVRAYEQAMKIWQPLGVKNLNLTWAFMSEKDYDWWLNRVEKFDTEKTSWETKVWNPKTRELGHCRLDAFSFCGYGSPKPSGKSFQYNVIGSRYSLAPNANTVNHEAVHFYQDSIDTGLASVTPCWFVEGQANLLGHVLDEANRVPQNRLIEISRVKENIPKAPGFNRQQWIKELNDFDGPRREFCIKTELSYSLGMFIFEYLYANYSFKQMHELVLSISQTKSFSAAVEETLGTTQEALYRDIARYLSRQFRS